VIVTFKEPNRFYFARPMPRSRDRLRGARLLISTETDVAYTYQSLDQFHADFLACFLERFIYQPGGILSIILEVYKNTIVIVT
jgi:hypothetical protein